MCIKDKASVEILTELCKKYNQDFYELHDLITAIRSADYEARQGQTASSPIDIKHPQVIAFAKAMDEVLTKNDHKGSWQDCPISYLEHRLVEEMGEYFRSLEMDVKASWRKKELLDIADFCLFLWCRS